MKRLISASLFLPIALLAQSSSQVGTATVEGETGPQAVSISGLTSSSDANSIVLQWTTSGAASSSASCGAEGALPDPAQAAVTSHELPVAGLSPSTGYTCTVCSNGACQNISPATASAPSSTPIIGVSFGAETAYNSTSPPAQNQGDTYYNTVSSDGVTYVVTDDTTYGFGGSGSVNSAMMVSKFTSLSPLIGQNVNTLEGFGNAEGGPSGSGLSSKLSGLISFDGCLFGAVGYQNENDSGNYNQQYYGNIIRSCDHGATWTNIQGTNSANGTIPSPYTTTSWPGTTPTNFASPNWVMYGADDGTMGYTTANDRVQNANAYVYVISNGQTSSHTACWTDCDAYYLARTPRATLLANPGTTVWQFYTGGDGTQDGAWSTTQANATPILSNAAKLSLASIQYIPALNRYLLLTWYYPSGYGNTTTWEAYDAPAPWGPFTSVPVTNQPTGYGYYNPVPLQADALAATFSSTTMRVLFAGYWSGSEYSLQFATMTVQH